MAAIKPARDFRRSVPRSKAARADRHDKEYPHAVTGNNPNLQMLSQAVQLLRAGQPHEAIALLDRAISGVRSVTPAHTLRLEALISMGELARARGALDAALLLELGSADACDGLAFFARQLDLHELSNELYREATKRAPNDAQIWYNLATSERSLGRLPAAIAACACALRINPDLRPALLLRSEMGRASSESNNVDELSRRIADGRVQDTTQLFFALGKELHELGRYDEAFAAFSRGARLRRLGLHYEVDMDERKIRRVIEVFGEGFAESEPAGPARHIFIVGLPRSGTTLTERILSGLPGVRSNNETNNFSTALLRCSPKTGGDVFVRASQADFEAVAREYDRLAVSDGFAGHVIEKLPFNYLYVGPILRAIPDAAIIWVRRNPIDSCFAMYRTLFGAGYPFSYDFEELARYYAAYSRLMSHWMSIFPGRLTTVDYEDLVAAPDLVSPRLAKRCGLSWAAGALDIAANPAASLTASASQVREGIYKTSAGIWRKYGRHLQPLAECLEAQGVAVAG